MIGILASTDKGNGPPPAGLLPLSLFILVLGLGAAMGMNTSYALNPARDLGPRILTAMVGYGRAGKHCETERRRGRFSSQFSLKLAFSF